MTCEHTNKSSNNKMLSNNKILSNDKILDIDSMTSIPIDDIVDMYRQGYRLKEQGNLYSSVESLTDATIAALASGIIIAPLSASIGIGGTQQLLAGCVLNDAPYTCPTLTWSSSSPSVATVNSSGLVTGVASGSTNITASASGYTSNISTITVPTLDHIGPQNTSVFTGNLQQFYAYDQFGNTYTTGFGWYVVPGGVGSIDANGLYYAGQTAGSATIAAVYSGVVRTTAITVNNPPSVLYSIAITPTTASIQTGTSQQLSATCKDQYGANFTCPALIWAKTSGPGSINSSGLYSAGQTPGTATITASASGVTSNTSTITVNNPPPVLSSIAITPTTASIQIEMSQQLSATCKDQYGANFTCPALTWTKTSGPGSLSSSGLYSSGLAPGTATITASASGVTSNTSTITVTFPIINTILIGPLSASIGIGNTQQLSAGCIINGVQAACPTLTWTSSSPSVATVNSSGLVTGVASGSTNITASAYGYTSNISTITVPTLDHIGPQNTSVFVYNFQQFHAYDQLGNTYTTGFGWHIVPGGVGSIDANGLYYAGQTAGSATIAAVYSGVVRTTGITVNNNPPVLSSIAITPTTASIQIEMSQQLSATCKDQYGADFTCPALTWTKTSGPGSLSSSGLYSSGLAPGTATITASASGVTSNTSTITVTFPTINAIAVTPLSASIRIGDTQQLSATCIINGVQSTCPTLTWSSSSPSVATVNSSGLVTGATSGSTNITASAYGYTSNISTITVPTLDHIGPQNTSVFINNFQQFYAYDQFGNTYTTGFGWYKIGTGSIDTNGLYYAGPTAGTATIGAVYSGVVRTTGITVNNPPPPVLSSIAASGCDTIQVGNTCSFALTCLDQYGNTISCPIITYIGFYPEIATISTDGVITGVGPGIESFLILDPNTGISTTKDVSVTNPPPVLSSIAITPTTASIRIETSQQLSAICKDQYGADFTCPALTWTKTSGVGSVNSSGLYSAGLAPGTATITASAPGVTSNTSTITATIPPIDAIVVLPLNSSLKIGNTVNIMATLLVQGVPQPNGIVTWTSSDNTVATVVGTDAPYYHHATATVLAPGRTNITASIGTYTSNVSTITVPALDHVEPQDTSIYTGETQQFYAYDQFGQAYTTGFGWYIVSGVGSIDVNGLYSAGTLDGQATIGASYENVLRNANITVELPPPVLTSILASKCHTVQVGDTCILDVACLDQYSDIISCPNLTYTSLDQGIATISSNGMVTGISPGSTSLSVSNLNTGIYFDKTITVIPTPANITIQNITIGGVPCAGACSITCVTNCPAIVEIIITWGNSGGSSGTFTPWVTVTGGSQTTGTQITVTPGGTETTTFSGVSLPQGTRDICFDTGIIT
jgi:uncharacterized protein YjdB